MKRIVIAVTLLSLTMISGVFAAEEKNKVVTISELKADISGDGEEETVALKGIPYQDENSYLKEIYIEILSENDKTYRIPLESGSKASLELVDLNHDGVKDVFATVCTGGSGGILVNSLYSFKDFALANLTVPDPLETESRFLNNYQAEIVISETDKRYLFDLTDRKKYYEKLGFFHNGRLNEPTELTVNPYSTLKPFKLNDENTGLKGIQRVTGIANADSIAYLETSWIYKAGKWMLANVDVKKEINQD